ncbi:M23 family metallopeptidase [Aestuariimicrobium sp. p3-SID1156]|uniref:M23 family metallopeptidase n=1 Tax=Aestuariimicrobium sp. p3-SID1156 TaxID=2916038 RepID=UPI00223A782C|nr:M23 family metallopeptidase [Aestuariimicrobium sp. p3-SID1156]MCT1460276.1 M23 family metallopeptidase [Aestuariimicrobium sp. p3-SID1156]
MDETTARLALRRTFRTRSASSVTDFESASESRSVVRPALVAFVVSSLGILGAGGVAVAAAASSTEQAKTSLVTDKDTPDTSQAAPEDISLDANQKAAAAQGSDHSAGQDQGGLQQFGQRGTTPNRNGVRSALNSQLAHTKSAQRSQSLQQTNMSVASAQAKAEAAERERLMAKDVAKVKAEAARIKEEKRKAAEALKKLQEEAKRRAAAQARSKQASSQGAQAPAAESEPAPADGGAGTKLNTQDLQSIAKGGSALPLRPGTYSTGAYFGKTGSWARYHTGQDFPAPTGTPVYAASSGIVGGDMSAAGWAGAYYVTIHHSGGGSTLYAHLSARVVSAGQAVKAGQLIGYVGNEGRSFGAHLHFEYYPAGTTPGDVYSASDPMAWLRSLGLNA